nr:MAG TPA: hypothetical protein [Caudoviricetes sp.]
MKKIDFDEFIISYKLNPNRWILNRNTVKYLGQKENEEIVKLYNEVEGKFIKGFLSSKFRRMLGFIPIEVELTFSFIDKIRYWWFCLADERIG